MTIKNLMFRFLSRVDPSLKAGTALDFTGGGGDNTSTWASTGGERFSAARAIDIYNEGRLALYNAISASVDPMEKSQMLASLINMTRIEFALATNESYYYVAQPTGYLEAISLYDGYKNEIIQILPSKLVDLNKSAKNARFSGTQHTSTVYGKRYVFEHAAGFIDYDGYCHISNMVGTGTAAFANGSATVTGTNTNWTTKNLAGATLKIASTSKVINSVTSNTLATWASTATGDQTTTTYYVSNLQLTYYKLADITSSDITTGTASDPWDEPYLPILVELMCAIANEQGMVEVDALAKKLLAITGKTKK